MSLTMMLRIASVLMFMLASVVMVGGCGDDDPVEFCNAEREQYLGVEPQDGCMTDTTVAACVACHDECGDACASVLSVCPVEYSCPN
jgi:hypothetical protein